MKTKGNRLRNVCLRLALCCLLIAGTVPVTARAEETTSGGSADSTVISTELSGDKNTTSDAEKPAAEIPETGLDTEAFDNTEGKTDEAPKDPPAAGAAASDDSIVPEPAEETENQTNGNSLTDKTSPVPAEASAAAPVEKPEQADAEAPEPEEAKEEPAENISNETFAEYSAAQWDYKKSIRASQLNDQFETDVTLTLPSAEVKLASEVCFVLDKSSFSDTKDQAMSLLGELKAAAEKTGARVQVDIIEFNRTGHDHGSYDLATKYDEIQTAFNKQNGGGTNLHAGLLAAKEVLTRNTDIPDSRKYMILVSDGDTYLYCKNGDYNVPYSRSFIPVEKAGGTAYGGFYDESWYYPSAPYDNNVGRPTTSDPQSWDAYLKDVAARNSESNGDAYDFVWKYYDGWKNMTSDQIASDGFKTMKGESRTASNMDMAFLHAANTYHELASRYHCYSVAVQSLNEKDGGHRAFMEYLNGNAVADFVSIKNQILYMLGNGSTIEDHIGFADNDYDFDLKKPEDMTIVVSNGEGVEQTLAAEKITENRFGFGKKDDGTYRFEVTYVPGEKKADEHFIWKTNENVTNFERIRLNYRLTLVNPKSAAGTYGEYDEFGEQHKEALRVTTNTVLRPVDSNGVTELEEEFLLPTVSYSVKAAEIKPSESTSQGSPASSGSEKAALPVETPQVQAPAAVVPAASVSPVTTPASPARIQTGDESNIMLWLFLMAAAAGGAGVLILQRRIAGKNS